MSNFIYGNKKLISFYRHCIILSILVINTGCSSLFFFYPQKQLAKNPFLEAIPHEDIYFKAPDNVKLHGWLLRTKGKSNGTILYLHGNTENISVHVNNVIWLTKEGYDVFAFDYRGYGKSEGSPTFEGVHLDAKAALEEVLNLPGINKDRVFIFGQSLGGAIAVYTAATSEHKDQIKALIIDSAFSDYRLIAREKISNSIIGWPFQYPVSFLIDDKFSPAKWIKDIFPMHVLIIHGDRDTTVPVHHGSILYDAALNPKEFWFVKNVGHDQALDHSEIKEKFLGYLRNVN